jgi:hypothetical protein
VRRAILAGAALFASACGGAPPGGGGTTVEPERRRCTAALRFQEPAEAEESDPAPPRTAITLVLICEDRSTASFPVGDEVGACYPIDAAGALLRARCWWAGVGAIVEVHRRGDALIVVRSAVDEHTGIGAPRTVGELEVSEGADVGTL